MTGDARVVLPLAAFAGQLAAGFFAGSLLALVHAFFVLSRGTNQLATGLVVWFLDVVER